jgi:hypothetical protein
VGVVEYHPLGGGVARGGDESEYEVVPRAADELVLPKRPMSYLPAPAAVPEDRKGEPSPGALTVRSMLPYWVVL